MEIPEDAKDFKIKLESHQIKLEPDEGHPNFCSRLNEIKLEEIVIKEEPLEGIENDFKIEENVILSSSNSLPNIACEDSSFNHRSLADYLSGKGNFKNIKIRVIYEEPQIDEEFTETRTDSMSYQVPGISALTDKTNSVDDFIENNPQLFDETAKYLEHGTYSSNIEGNNSIVCQFCRKSYKGKGDLKRHIEAFHFNIKPFHCNICNKDFTRKNSLEKHMNKFHGRDKSLKCCICSFQAGSKYVLKRHLTGVHKKESSIVYCAYCNCPFKHKQYLINHLKRAHLSMFAVVDKNQCTKNYRNNELNKQISKYNSEMKNRTRPKKRSYQKCPHCLFYARDLTRLEGHINSKHKLIKPYRCNLCSYSAANKEYLRLHVLSRHNSKYQCNYCCLSFKSKLNLKNHYYQCHSSRFLDDHFICHYCYEIYHCKINFLKHLNMQHRFKFNK